MESAGRSPAGAVKWPETVAVERQGFVLKVPDSWWEFDIRPDTRDNSIRTMVNERVRAAPELAEHRSTIEAFLRRQAREAWDSGCAYIGCMADTFGGETPITATMTVSLLKAPTQEDGTRLSSAPAEIAKRMREITPGKEGDPWRRVSTVEIPGVGTVARTEGVEDITPPQHKRSLRVVLTQTFIPMPGGSGQVALVTGSSQLLELADSFFDVFDAVTSTFRFA